MAAESAMMSVLVVDDDASIRGLLDIVLRRTMSVDCVPDGAEALARLQRQTYSVILLDLMMPDCDGVEFLRLVSEAKPELLQRIIVLTAVSQTTLDRITAETKDVWGVVRKPFDLGDLVRSVTDCAAHNGHA